jgi:hypothetical protein
LQLWCARSSLLKLVVGHAMSDAPDSKLGFARTTKGKLLINGLRPPLAGDTNGWYIWCGEDFSGDPEFFDESLLKV